MEIILLAVIIGSAGCIGGFVAARATRPASTPVGNFVVKFQSVDGKTRWQPKDHEGKRLYKIGYWDRWLGNSHGDYSNRWLTPERKDEIDSGGRYDKPIFPILYRTRWKAENVARKRMADGLSALHEVE